MQRRDIESFRHRGQGGRQHGRVELLHEHRACDNEGDGAEALRLMGCFGHGGAGLFSNGNTQRICHTAALRQSYGKKQVKHGFLRSSSGGLGKNQVRLQQIFTGITGYTPFHAFYGYAIAVFR
jgi:hypothetical protein